MTDIFLSYKREDEARVARLVKRLEGARLSVWWDRGLAGGEGWREGIERALEAAKVVVVCWTYGAVGPEGRFVRDEAARAGARLIPVLLDPVRPPLGFGEVQAFDLTRWRGSAGDPFFQDLLAAIEAKRIGAPPPKPKGPARRALARFVYGGGAAAFVLALATFAWSTPLVRESTCALPVPGLAGACCNAGFTEKALVRDAAFTPAPLERTGYLRTSEQRFGSEAQARAHAEARLAEDAALLCAVADPAHERLAGIDPRISRLDCREDAQGWTCAADYAATCRIEQRLLVARCPG